MTAIGCQTNSGCPDPARAERTLACRIFCTMPPKHCKKISHVSRTDGVFQIVNHAGSETAAAQFGHCLEQGPALRLVMGVMSIMRACIQRLFLIREGSLAPMVMRPTTRLTHALAWCRGWPGYAKPDPACPAHRRSSAPGQAVGPCQGSALVGPAVNGLCTFDGCDGEHFAKLGASPQPAIGRSETLDQRGAAMA